MSTQPYPSQPLFTPGVILGIIVFLLTCGGIVFGKYYTDDMKTKNEQRMSTIANKVRERNDIEKDTLIQTYRLVKRNENIITKQKKFSNIPHFFQTFTDIQNKTHVHME